MRVVFELNKKKCFLNLFFPSRTPFLFVHIHLKFETVSNDLLILRLQLNYDFGTNFVSRHALTFSFIGQIYLLARKRI